MRDGVRGIEAAHRRFVMRCRTAECKVARRVQWRATFAFSGMARVLAF
jgi:hypothetical protein